MTFKNLLGVAAIVLISGNSAFAEFKKASNETTDVVSLLTFACSSELIEVLNGGGRLGTILVSKAEDKKTINGIRYEITRQVLVGRQVTAEPIGNLNVQFAETLDGGSSVGCESTVDKSKLSDSLLMPVQ